MNKNQKNRKLIQQNKRNKMINRRYTSTIKTIFKIELDFLCLMMWCNLIPKNSNASNIRNYDSFAQS